jgi:hypothetical protein
MQPNINRQNLKQRVDKAKCLAVIDLVLILPKTTAPAWTINWRVDTLYDLNIYESFIAIY